MNRYIAKIKYSKNRDTLYLFGLLGLVVVLPTIGLLWFMSNAIDSEKLAVEQKLVKFYSSQINRVQPVINKFWNERRLQLSYFNDEPIPSKLFVSLINNRSVDSAVIFGPDGRLMYPFLVTSLIFAPGGISETIQNISNEWETAHKKEFGQKDPIFAIAIYNNIVKKSKSTDEIAEALQSQIRCLLKLDRQSEAIALIDDELNKKKYSRAKDSYGRLIVPNVQLMALSIINHKTHLYKKIKGLLIQRLNDYNQYYFPTSQRLFLMRRLLKLDSHLSFTTLTAETYLNELLSLNKLYWVSASFKLKAVTC